MLNHTSGLQNALGSLTRENPLLMTDWDECLNCLTKLAPETEPGREQMYHYLSFGWLCGGIIEVSKILLFHHNKKGFDEPDKISMPCADFDFCAEKRKILLILSHHDRII